MKKNNFLNAISLKKGENGNKLIYFISMSDLDIFGNNPEEGIDGRFYFTIEIDGRNLNFYQIGEYPNAFADEYVTQSFVFAPDNEQNVELHIINDYE